MKELTAKQKAFLKKHDVDLKYVFDAKGLSNSEYQDQMRLLNKIVAYNVTPCKNAGHTLRNRAGHCSQCNTAHLAFQKRNSSSGVVYIAGSLSGSIIKIGFTKAVEVRAKSLIRTKYAGHNDWKILYAFKSEKAGVIENKANSLLRKYAFSLDYEHDGHTQSSHETYNCAYSKAKAFVSEAVKSESKPIELRVDIPTNQYEFKNLRKA